MYRLFDLFFLIGRNLLNLDGGGAVNCVRRRYQSFLRESFGGTPQMSRIESESRVCVSLRYHIGKRDPNGNESFAVQMKIQVLAKKSYEQISKIVERTFAR